MTFDSQVLGQPLQRQAIGLAMLAHKAGMGRAEDDIDQIRELLDDFGQGTKHIFNAFVR